MKVQPHATYSGIHNHKDKSQARDRKEAGRREMAGCVNIIDGMKSIYYWDNSL